MIVGIAVYINVIKYHSLLIIANNAITIYPNAHPIDKILGASCLIVVLDVSVKYIMHALKYALYPTPKKTIHAINI